MTAGQGGTRRGRWSRRDFSWTRLARATGPRPQGAQQDDGPAVQIGLTTSVGCWCKSTVYTLKDGLSSDGNVWSKGCEEFDEILSCVEIAFFTVMVRLVSFSDSLKM